MAYSLLYYLFEEVSVRSLSAWAYIGCLFLSGCGLKLGFPTATQTTQSGSGRFTEGYYVASSDVSIRHYPLIVIRQKDNELFLFQLSNIDQMSFGLGARTKDLSTPYFATEVTKGLDRNFVGSVRPEGAMIRLQSRKIKPGDEKDPKFPEVGEVLSNQDYTLKNVPKNELIKELRSLRKLTSPQVFTALEEDGCLVAFNLNCSDVYFSPLR